VQRRKNTKIRFFFLWTHENPSIRLAGGWKRGAQILQTQSNIAHGPKAVRDTRIFLVRNREGCRVFRTSAVFCDNSWAWWLSWSSLFHTEKKTSTGQFKRTPQHTPTSAFEETKKENAAWDRFVAKLDWYACEQKKRQKEGHKVDHTSSLRRKGGATRQRWGICRKVVIDTWERGKKSPLSKIAIRQKKKNNKFGGVPKRERSNPLPETANGPRRPHA